LYLEEHDDAQITPRAVEHEGRSALLLAGDIGYAKFCDRAVEDVVACIGRLDILVNNAGEQHWNDDIRDITDEQLKPTFQTNVFGMSYLTQAAVEHIAAGGAIINCTSVTMYEGAKGLLDYSATKGAIKTFTRSLSENLIETSIRVKGVAPGPIWTPLNPMGGAPPEKIATFGESTSMTRAGQPNQVAPSLLFLACDDSSYMSGQVLHPNGGTIVNG